MRRTKIICTVGPASNSWETIKGMYEAGMNVLRINMSHSDHDDAEKAIRWIGTLNRSSPFTVPILLDTSGPEIRTGQLVTPMKLRRGDDAWISSSVNGAVEEGSPCIEVNYPDFNDHVMVGDTIRLDNGLINLRVVSCERDALLCRVVDGGTLESHKHVNLPGVHVKLPSITSKDVDDIRFGLEHAINYVAQSFVRTADDIREMREVIGERHQWVKIIAKIENQEGVDNVEAIANEAHGVMVARGDLGIETDMAELPFLQRTIVEKTIRAGRRCIVATHMLESMVEHPIPTRAEVHDVANAVEQEVDAILLSAETSIGAYPVRAVEYVRRVAEAQEQLPGLRFAGSQPSDTHRQQLAWSAVELAERISATGIIVITRSGWTADILTNCAPPTVPIFAFSNESHTRRRLALNRGVYAYRIDFSSNPEKTIQRCIKALLRREQLPEDSPMVVVSDAVGLGGKFSIQIRQLRLPVPSQNAL
ncbi:MAG: pyruvate kinase [Gammaproteobacteria bacterium]|nr:pyruvate kinase [Gammaproteobacteria bacterium]